MSATKILLDKYRETCLPANDNGIAKRLGVSRAAVSRWVNGQGHPNPEAIEQMAKDLGEITGPWLAQIEAERARTPHDKRVWLRLAATLGTALAITLIALPHVAAAASRWLPIVSNYARRAAAILWGAARPTPPDHSRCAPFQAYRLPAATA